MPFCYIWIRRCPRLKISTMPAASLANRSFDPGKILATVVKGRRVVTYLKKQTIFAQGDAAGAVFYIQKGTVRQTVVSRFGKEATLDILNEREFFGDGGLAGQPLRVNSATALTDCILLRFPKNAMVLALSRRGTFFDMFVAHLLTRNLRYQEGLIDQLFDSCEKRLARVLLLHAHFDREGASENVIPNVREKILADEAGTTRLRVRFFMRKFRRSGCIANGRSGLYVRNSLLKVAFHD